MSTPRFDEVYSKKRNQTADLMKGFAVLMMIQVHLMELFAKPEISQSLLGKISLFLGGPPAAPLFMAVMGFFLAASKKNFLQNLKRGVVLICGGILLNIGLNMYLLLLISFGKLQLDPLGFILGADILPLAGMSIILITAIKNLLNKNYYAQIITVVLIMIIISIAHGLSLNYVLASSKLRYLQAFFWGSIDWSYFPLLPWAIYPLAGYLCGISMINYNLAKTTKYLLAVALAIFTFITIKYGIGTASDLQTYYHHDFIYSFWIIQFLILLTYVLHKVEVFRGKNDLLIYVKWLGKNVTVVYVFQWLLIGNIATALYKTQDIISLIVWFILIVSVVTLLTFLFEKYFNLITKNIEVKNYT
jgi:hypothetical protein